MADDCITVLLDTSFLVAHYNHRDGNHQRAIKLLLELETNQFGSLVISDYVFDETITLIKKYLGNKQAIEKGNELLNSIELTKVDTEVFRLSWEISKRFDNLSFTDCSNLAVMRHYGLEHLATFDSGFNGIVKVLG